MDRRITLGISTSVLLLIGGAVVLPAIFVHENPAVAISYPAYATTPPPPALDTKAYDLKLQELALGPANGAYPSAGALLPFNRIVAYYGNFSSKYMGVLGKYPPDEMLSRLQADVKKWETADPATPVIPGIDYIAVTAQHSPGPDHAYRLRMPDAEIQKAIGLADKVHGVVILEVQPGLADLMGEVKALEPYLSLPQVNLAVDPEFVTRRSGLPPGTVVGTVDAKDVNAIAGYLASLVQAHGLPPKILVVHRYTREMVTHAENIAPLPEVEVVLDMDGWGPPSQKLGTYAAYVASQAIQFTGFKLFFRNDLLRAGSRMLLPEEILKLTPAPSFIQYQ